MKPFARKLHPVARGATFMLHFQAWPTHQNLTARTRRATPASHPPDRFERETIEILKRVSRRPIEPAPDKELLADLGFDSLQVLELVGELEDHFEVAVPLNDLTHIRTVGQIIDEVRKLFAAAGEGRPA